jgi:hypothetical protein
MLLHTIAVAILVLVVGWMAGGLVLRAGGLLAVTAGLLAATGDPAGLLLAVLGILGWLAGHWLYALRHHAFKSPLARRIYLQLLPRRLDPTRRWAIPTTGSESS